ncbi:MAG: ribose 1,5-bisphosphate isomerase [Thermoplasmatota archaeon]
MASDPVEEAAEDIASMRVRGAGKIARHAARALAKWSAEAPEDAAEFDAQFTAAVRRLLATRPTAVSLRNALRFVERRVAIAKGVSAKRAEVARAAKDFVAHSESSVTQIGEAGAPLIHDGRVYLTHCNSQAALSVFRAARAKGRAFEVIACETRPWRQGLITTKELAAAGVPVTLIVDSAMLHELPRVDAVIVGADTIAANGDVVNKVGTSLAALAAREMGRPFYVAAESYKVDPSTPSGAEIVIEERAPAEIAAPSELAPGVRVLNPVFDVTPAAWISALITEHGIVPPSEALAIYRKSWE